MLKITPSNAPEGGRREKMQNTTQAYQRIVAKANAFINNDTNDPETVEDVKYTLGRFTEALEAQNDARAVRLGESLQRLTKGTRISVSLHPKEKEDCLFHAQALVDLFNRFPTLSVPREHTLEKFTVALEKAFLDNKREAAKEASN